MWGEKDIKNASQNDAICEANFADGFLFFDTDKINDESQSCYIMLIAECECDKLSDNEGLLRLGNLYGGEFDEKNRYIFNLKDGEHVYLFRVSADYYWNQKLLNGILLQGEEIKTVRMYLIEGD